MPETLNEFIKHPLVIGLLLGLAVALFVWIRAGWIQCSKKAEANEKIEVLRSEINKLQNHLHMQMEIGAKGNEAIRQDVDELKRQNDNLKGVVAALKSKPGRTELRTLHLYEKAIRLMNARAPGFGPVWESVMVDAEAEIKKEESGLLAWIRKPFLPSLSSQNRSDQTAIRRAENPTAE